MICTISTVAFHRQIYTMRMNAHIFITTTFMIGIKVINNITLTIDGIISHIVTETFN